MDERQIRYINRCTRRWEKLFRFQRKSKAVTVPQRLMAVYPSPLSFFWPESKTILLACFAHRLLLLALDNKNFIGALFLPVLSDQPSPLSYLLFQNFIEAGFILILMGNQSHQVRCLTSELSYPGSLHSN